MIRSYEADVVSRIKTLKGLDIKEAGKVKFDNLEYMIYYFMAQSRNSGAKNVFLSAGIHGDEPAGVYALLDFFEKKIHDYLGEYSFFAFPCLNPSGFERNTMENIRGINLNREFQNPEPAEEIIMLKHALANGPSHYLFALDMHEDDPDRAVNGCDIKDNPRGFYLYESSPNKELRKGHMITSALEKNSVPICKNERIYYDKSDNGLVWASEIINKGHDEDKTLIWYLKKHTAHVFNAETPTCWELEKRIEVQVKALEIALNEFKK